ncbi:cilia- and flagella-associated protein 43 [Sphaeramia orbicularis]|uniref:cilia- and flagella-associated protein 43 n=1 Tax=Sphaeramia orbicularis TaxID=375764 RepID=UPI00117C952C|nr:cilia- and flagella-associated protein 43 [Sphaeramia orbicularis]
MDEIGQLEVRWIQGFTGKNVEFVDNNTVCYPCGNHLVFLNLSTKEQSVFEGPGCRGISAFTANGNSGVFAVSERKLDTSIFVYNYPDLGLKNELKGSAKLDYTSLALSDGGPYLVCCSSLPDHTITVWNWENAEPVCTQPQAGRDVISLAFNPLNWLQVCALGTSSLTVWNIQKNVSCHVLKPSLIELPAVDGTIVERLLVNSHSISEKLTYLGPELPPSAISGLKGDKTESIVNKLCTKPRVTPTAICWTATSQLYVGCEEGFLLLVDPESHSVSILYNPTTADAIPELKQSSFQCLALNRNGLITVGKNNMAHCLEIKGIQITITQSWELDGPITTVMYSPNYETLFFSSNMGKIYTLNTSQSEEIVNVLDALSGDFVAAALSHTDKNICVSVQKCGQLQVLSTDGTSLGSLSLQTEVTSMACCPIANYAAVGTSSGRVLFIDLNRQQPRVVHQIHLYRATVDHLVFDPNGHFLFTGASDAYIYVLDAKPSTRFSVKGFTVARGSILSLAAQYINDSEQVKVLALCTHKDKKSSSLLTLLTLSVKDLSGPDCVDRHGCLSNHILKMTIFEVPHLLTSCVLGVNEVFAYCHKRRALQRFQLPQDSNTDSRKKVVQLKPEQEVKGHPLGPVSLTLSPHQLWLASLGRDGVLRVRETVSMEHYIELQCHSLHLGGLQIVSFSADSQTLLTAGCKDGSLVCLDLRFNDLGAAELKEATQYCQSMDYALKNVFQTENHILRDWPDWSQWSNAGDTDVNELSRRAENGEVTDLDESSTGLLLQLTWLENRREAVVKEDNEQNSEVKEKLRKSLKALHDIVQDMMQENENLPTIQRLEQHEFNLDVDEQRRLEALVHEEATRVRTEKEWDIVANRYLWDILKRQYWDSMEVKSKSIKAFHSEHEVKNYPLTQRTETELDELRRVQNVRKIEMASCTSTIKKMTNTSSAKEDEKEAEDQEVPSAAVMGCSTADCGYSSPYLYDQFTLQTTEQKINQIILLQDVIYQVKTAFNTEFEAVHKQKVQELSRIRERNKRIKAIMRELDVKETLWEPCLSADECPEKLLSVDDSEIKAEKYLTPEQREEEERKRLEEQRRFAAKGDNSREKALDDMMDGVLEVKKEDVLKMEIPPPEFVLTKPDIHWTEEEKKAYREYEKKSKELHEEKEKYKKILETEMKKLQESTKDATEKLDETLKKLFEKKVKCEFAVYQEELKITDLVYSVFKEEGMRNRALELKLKLENVLEYKDEVREEVKKCEEEVEEFQCTYNAIVAKDKDLDKNFKREFCDVPRHILEQLYKLFKRRPRVQKTKTQADNTPNPFTEQRQSASLAPDGLVKMMKAMEEMDDPKNIPEGLNAFIWERFCRYRRTKIESEHQVKMKTHIFAEMQSVLQKMTEESMAAEEEFKNISDELERLHREKNRFLSDVMVQVLPKQGQVEASVTDLTLDYSDSVLVNRTVVDDLKKTIRTLGDEKINLMVKCKDIRKFTIQQEWEDKKLNMQIEDLINKARDIKTFRISEEQREYLNKKDKNSQVSMKVVALENVIAMQEKSHLKRVEHRKRRIKELKRRTQKCKSTAVSDERLAEMHAAVSEKMHIYEAIAVEEKQAAKREQRYQEIVQRKRLEDLARAQAQELAVLWAEVERLRMKNFPALNLLKHN